MAEPALFHAPLLVCNDEQRFIVAKQLRLIGIAPHTIVLEPSRATRRRRPASPRSASRT